MNENNRPVTEVAAGILLDSGGRYLLGQRPEGKPYAGYWEVPGGKIEQGESVFEALKRELHEELRARGVRRHRLEGERPELRDEKELPQRRLREVPLPQGGGAR